jgi:hypothetical protein
MAKLLPRSVRLIHQREVQAANGRLRLQHEPIWLRLAQRGYGELLFFSSLLETERPAGKTYRTRNETRADMFGCIE